MSKHSCTAEITYKYLLVLNPITSNTEAFKVFEFDTPEEARSFYNAELVEHYRDEGPDAFNPGYTKTYVKSFKKGGPLEWYNPIEESQWTTPSYHQHGLHKKITDIDNINIINKIY